MREISYELLHKYNVQGPRYTSYPPAPSWKKSFGVKDFSEKIEASNAVECPRPLSFYVHLPFCEDLCYFCGCTTVITGQNHALEDPYVGTLLKEIEWLASRVERGRPIVQFHFGGGTPTYLTAKNLERIMTALQNGFDFSADAEMGVEIDPRVTTIEHLEVLRRLGFNRLSMGVQDFDQKVQETIHRFQPYEETRRLVGKARALSFESINIDLIYGLPYQTPGTFEKTISKVLTLNPDRLAVYSYAHVPWMKRVQKVFESHLPAEGQKYEIFLTALRKFGRAGYEYIGMDHFAKPTDELALARKNRTLWRNFQGYTTKAGTDLFSVGMSAISHLRDSFFQNHKSLKDYRSEIDRVGVATERGFILSFDDRVRSRVIENLLCHAVVGKSDIEKEFGIVFDDYFGESLKKLAGPINDQLVEVTSRDIRPTPAGRVFLRNLAMPFDAYLPQEGERIFSRTV